MQSQALQIYSRSYVVKKQEKIWKRSNCIDKAVMENKFKIKSKEVIH